jgi:hypothetical protein
MALDPAALLAAIEVELERLNDATLTTKVRAAATAAGNDAQKLGRYLMDLKRR